jgi:hypothetical protein
MQYGRLALILDDEAGQIGELALLLVRLGVNVLYANDFDEAVLLAREATGNVGAVIVPCGQANAWLPMILKRMRVPPEALVPAGERPDDDTLAALRAQGARWVLRLPDDDRAVRFVVTSAMSETDDTEIRFYLRLPTDFGGSVQHGSLQRPCEIRNLSPGGALVAMEPLFPVGGRIMLSLDLGDTSLTLGARIAWSTECTGVHPVEASPVMGVSFDDVDPETRDVLSRFLEGEIRRFRL